MRNENGGFDALSADATERGLLKLGERMDIHVSIAERTSAGPHWFRMYASSGASYQRLIDVLASIQSMNIRVFLQVGRLGMSTLKEKNLKKPSGPFN